MDLQTALQFLDTGNTINDSENKLKFSEDVDNFLEDRIISGKPSSGAGGSFAKPTLKEKVVDELRATGAIAGGLGMFPIAGIAGLSRLITTRDLDEAEKTLESFSSLPNILLKTPRQQKMTENTANLLSLPIRKSGQGLGAITELATTQDLEKATDVATGKSAGSTIGVPIAKTLGEVAAMVAMGNARRKGKYTIGNDRSVLERLEKPNKIESDFAKQQFTNRFLEEKPEISEGTPKAPTIESEISPAQKSAQVFLKEFDEAKSPKARELLHEKLSKEQAEKGFEPVFGEKLKDLRSQELPPLRPKIESQVEKDFAKFGKVKLDKDGKSIDLYSGIPIIKAAEFWTNDVGGIVWDKAIQKGIPKLLEKIPGGKSVNRALIYDYRGDLKNTETYIKSLEDMKNFQAIGREYALDLGQRLQSFDEVTQIKIGEYITSKEPKVKLSGKALETAKEAKQTMLDLGKQAVDAGLLSEETFFKNAGQYMPRLYTSKEYQSLLTKFNITKPNRLDLSRFKARKDIPKEIREQMGEILTPGYPIAKGITQLTHDIELARFFNGVARIRDWAIPKSVKDVPIPEGFKKLPSNPKLGQLNEAYVHPEIFKDLQETIRIMEAPERIWRKALGSWKFGKVILSPKTHIRNLMSNSILAHLGGMPMYEQPFYLIKAAKSMSSKGDYWKIAKQEGLLRDTFTNAELRTLFGQVESQLKGVKALSIPEALGKIGILWEKSKTGLNKAAKLYEAEEQWFKIAKMIHNIERGKMTPRAAAVDAEKWLFNYSKLTRFQEKYRSSPWGAPFATFTFKAIPRVAEAMIKTPWRFALPFSMIYGMEKAAQKLIGDTKSQINAKRELLPDWMKGSMLGMPNFARFPIIDESGREYYLNLTYILPWGDLGEGGDFGPIPGSLLPLSQPFVKEGWQQIGNWDNFWKENIVKDSDLAGRIGWDKLATKAKIRGKHVGTTLAPTPVIDIGKGVAALKNEPDYRGRLKPKKAIAADVLAGIKLYPVDYVERTVQEINRLNPDNGYLAQEIKSDLKTLNLKSNALKKAGKDSSIYQDQINDKINQLKGLAEETKKIAEASKKINKIGPSSTELKNMTINVTATHDRTGKKFKIQSNAYDAINNNKARTAIAEELLECLK